MEPKKILIVNPIPKPVILQQKHVPVPQIIIKKPNTSSCSVDATVETSNKSTNTDLTMKQIKIEKEKTNYNNEGFKTYYDHKADVIGIFCFICCNNFWNKCNNVFKGCKNSISCPLYCWFFFIMPLFIILILVILINFLIGLKIFPT